MPDKKSGRFIKGDGGRTPGAGRKKGVPNKLNTDTKKLILQALHESDPEGAIGYLKKIAKENSTAFVSLVRACMPKEIVGKMDNNINVKQLNVHRLDISNLQEDELDALEGALRKTYMLENQKVIEASVIEDQQEEELLEMDADGAVH
jgi:Asp/Glu/hydantoin racemase